MKGKNIKTPNNRRERVEWFEKKFGYEYACTLRIETDRELKLRFEGMYRLYKDKDPKPFVEPETPAITCLVCEEEIQIEYNWHCACGVNEGVMDEEGLERKRSEQRYEEELRKL